MAMDYDTTWFGVIFPKIALFLPNLFDKGKKCFATEALWYMVDLSELISF